MALNVSKGIAHLDHLEDLVLLYGKDGAKLASETVDKFLRKFEKGAEESSDLTISEKIDGAPSLYFGTAPDDRFFVGTKGVLAKTEQKISYSLSDIQRFYPESGVKDVLARCFQALKPAFKEKSMACQGDLLWSDKSQKSESTIEGKQYLTFRPNTILYGIPVDPKSDPYKKASRAIIGIVIHGAYETQFVDGEKIEFNRQGIDRVKELAESINQHPNVFCIHPYIDNIDAIRGNEEILKELNETLASVNQAQNQIEPQFDREWKKGEEPYIAMAKSYLPQFVNQQVRSSGDSETILTAKDEKDFLKRFKKQFEEFVNVKGKAEIEKMKSLKGREQKTTSYKEFSEWMKQSSKTFEPMFLCFFRLFNVKGLIIQLLDGLEKKLGGTFVVDRKNDFEVKAVKPEGYVFLGGDNMVKIVDRLEFSKNNMLFGRFAEEKKEEKSTLILEKTIVDEVVEDVLSAMESIRSNSEGFEDQQIVEAANKMKDYTALYVGRFQPPTIAHVQNIMALSKLYKDVYVLVSKADNITPKYLQKNPLTDEERIKLLESDPKIRNAMNIHISSGPTFMAYGINSMNPNTGRPNEVEIKELMGIDPNAKLVLALGKEEDRYFETKENPKFFDVNSGELPSKDKRVGIYGMDLMNLPGVEEKVSASTIRDAIMNGDLDTAEKLLAGSDALKPKTVETIREKLEMINKTVGSSEAKQKKNKKAIKKLSEEVNQEIEALSLDEAFDIVLDNLEE